MLREDTMRAKQFASNAVGSEHLAQLHNDKGIGADPVKAFRGDRYFAAACGHYLPAELLVWG